MITQATSRCSCCFAADYQLSTCRFPRQSDRRRFDAGKNGGGIRCFFGSFLSFWCQDARNPGGGSIAGNRLILPSDAIQNVATIS